VSSIWPNKTYAASATLLLALGFTFALPDQKSPTAFGQPPAKAVPAAPKSLLIFYGWPSTINGVNRDIPKAVSHFNQYDIVVIGGGLESPKHMDHNQTRQIIKNAKSKFYGYVPLGNRQQDMRLSDKEIADRIALLKGMGAKGVLLDEFGFDFGVDRDRQNKAVIAAHGKGLKVIANAWNSDDVFLPDAAGVKPALKPDDAYLWESYRFIEGKPVALKVWRDKADKVEAGKKLHPLLVYSVSTNKVIPSDVPLIFTHQWFSAAIDGHEATGWGYPAFAAGDSKAPYFTPPDKLMKAGALGTRIATPVNVKGAIVTRATANGVIEVDTNAMTGKFLLKK
jgi:hypothetical protein